MAQFDAIIMSSNTALPDDSPYRVEAYQTVARNAPPDEPRRRRAPRDY